MSRYADTITDEYDRPVQGAEIRVVRTVDKVAPALTDDSGLALVQPIITDRFGSYHFNTADTLVDIEVRFGGRLRWRASGVEVGAAGSLFKGDKGDTGPPGANAGTIGANATTRTALKAVTGAAQLLPANLTEVGREGLFTYDSTIPIATHQADAFEAVYVAPSAAANGAWVRRSVGVLYPAMVGADETGATDTSSRINALLAFGNVELKRGATYGVSAPIIMPTNRKLYLNGATIKALPGYTPGAGAFNPLVGANGGSGQCIVGPGTVDVNKVLVGGVTRVNCIMMRGATGFHVGGGGTITLKNATGYASFSQFFAAKGADCSGHWEGIDVYNSQIHYEAMGVDTVSYRNIRSFDGDGDIAVQSYLHPLTGCKNVTFENFHGVGATAAVVEIISNDDINQGLIRFVNCYGRTTSGGVGFVANGYLGRVVEKLELVNSDFGSTTYYGAEIGAVASAMMIGSTFEGRSVGAGIGSGTWFCSGSRIVATNIGGAIATGSFFNGVFMHFDGGEISAIAPAGGNAISGGGKVLLSRDTRVIPNRGGPVLPIRSFASDHQTTSTAGVALGVDGFPATFPVEAGKRYRLTCKAAWNHDPASNGIVGLLLAGGAAGTVRGTIAMTTAAAAETKKTITAAAGCADAASSLSANMPSAAAFLPWEIDAAFICTTTGTLSLQIATSNAAHVMWVPGPFVVEFDEV